MHLIDLFENDFNTKDPKTQQALAKAKVKYSGIADNPMDAFMMSISDEQEDQDSQIDSQFSVDTDQGSSLRDLESRIQNLEQMMQVESKTVKKLRTLGEGFINIFEDNSINWEPQPDFRDRGGVSTSYGDSATRQRGMKGVSSNRRYQKQAPQEHPDAVKLNQAWKKYLKMLRTADTETRNTLVPTLKKIITFAEKRGIELTPQPKFNATTTIN